MLITVRARMVKPYGHDEVPLPDRGRVEFKPAAHGTHEGALRTRETVFTKIVDGVMDEVELTPGPWRVRVWPERDLISPSWESWLIELDGSQDPVDLVDLAPVLVVDGEKWTAGPPGASVVGGRDNGDGTVSFELSDGTYTEPVVLPPGPAGRGIVSISDPDEDSRVTVTFTDGTEATVQAIRGADGQDGQDGHTPVLTWQGTALVVDGQAPVDLKGEPGKDGTATLPDTGWRKIELPATHVTNSGHGLYVRRLGSTVHMTIAFQTSSAGGNPSIWTTVSGFHPRLNWPVVNANAASGTLLDANGAPLTPRALTVSSTRSVNIYNTDAGQARFAHLTYLTDEPFPTTLPGTPA